MTVTWPGREAPIAFSSASGKAAKATSRAEPIGRSRTVSLARWPSSRISAPGSRAASPSRECLASGAGPAGRGFRVGASASSQSTSCRKRTELIPSAIAWWIRQTIASRPSASGPATSKRHSGRPWSSRSDISAAASSQRPRSSMPSPPGTRTT